MQVPTNGRGMVETVSADLPIPSGDMAVQLQALVTAYDRLRERDGRAEYQAWMWQWVALVALVAVIGVSVLDHLNPRTRVQAFVQPVQVNTDGQVIQLGLPQDLMHYEPQDGQWLDMLGQWIRAVQWRGIDPTLAREQWRWAYLHSCGQASKLLHATEVRDKPFELGKRKVSVELKSLHKTPAPLSYQAIWEETIIEPTMQPRVVTMTGTFTVGRYEPKDMGELLQNRLGLCVTAYDLSPHPSSL